MLSRRLREAPHAEHSLQPVLWRAHQGVQRYAVCYVACSVPRALPHTISRLCGPARLYVQRATPGCAAISKSSPMVNMSDVRKPVSWTVVLRCSRISQKLAYTQVRGCHTCAT